MRVLLVNGSPHEKGCTHVALGIVKESLEDQGIQADFFWIGDKPLTGCIGCGYCEKAGRCRYDDRVNEFLAQAVGYDGFVFGVPVHFASAASSMSAFMDRAFFTDHCAGLRLFELKPGAIITSARCAGTTATLDQMSKYLMYAQMPVVSSRYWNMVHGQTPDQVLEDLEGVQIMRILGKNMAWLLQNIEAGKGSGVKKPEPEERINTNFITM